MHLFYNDPEEGPMLLIAYNSVETIDLLRERGRNDIADCLAGYGHLLPERDKSRPKAAGYTSPERFIVLIRARYGNDPHTYPQIQTLSNLSGFAYARREADSVADFLARYYKPDRYTGRGPEYAAGLLAAYTKEYNEKGWLMISRHDSVTGWVVSWYGPGIKSAPISRPCSTAY